MNNLERILYRYPEMDIQDAEEILNYYEHSDRYNEEHIIEDHTIDYIADIVLHRSK